MRPYLLSILLAGLPASALAAQQKLVQRLAAPPDGTVKISNPAGSVLVLGWDRDTVLMTGTIAAGARAFYGTKGRDTKVGVAVEESGGSVPRSVLEVRVPARSRVWVNGAETDIELAGVGGEVDVQGGTGRIRVEGAPRQVHVETIDGHIDLAADAPVVRAGTAGGVITIRGRPEDITATSVTGAIHVGLLGPVRRAHLESVSGEISFKGDPTPSASISVETHGGDVELRLPSDVAADFDVVSFGGTVTSEFRQRPQPRRGGGQALAFTHGAGGAQITVRTFKGTVRILRRTSGS